MSIFLLLLLSMTTFFRLLCVYDLIHKFYIFLFYAETCLYILFDFFFQYQSTRNVPVSYVEIHLLFTVLDMWVDLLCIDVL